MPASKYTQLRLPGTARPRVDWDWMTPSPFDEWWTKPYQPPTIRELPTPMQSPFPGFEPEELARQEWKQKTYKPWEYREGKGFPKPTLDPMDKVVEEAGEAAGKGAAAKWEVPDSEIKPSRARASRLTKIVRGTGKVAKTGLKTIGKSILPTTPVGAAADIALIGLPYAFSKAQEVADEGRTFNFGREGGRQATRQAPKINTPDDVTSVTDDELTLPEIEPPDDWNFTSRGLPPTAPVLPSFQPIPQEKTRQTGLLAGAKKRLLKGSPLSGFADLAPNLQSNIEPELKELEPLESKSFGQELFSQPMPGTKTQTSDDEVSSAFDQYQKLWGEFPSKEDYKPSIWRKLVGAMAGFSEGWNKGAGAGLDTARSWVEQPYNRAIGEWKGKLDELDPLMKQEVYKDINQQRIAEQARKTDLISYSKNIENEIRNKVANNKAISDAERNAISREWNKIRLLINGDRHDEAMERIEMLDRHYLRSDATAASRASTAASSAAGLNDYRKILGDVARQKMSGIGGSTGDPNNKVLNAAVAAQLSFNAGNSNLLNGIELPVNEKGDRLDLFTFLTGPEPEDEDLKELYYQHRPEAYKAFARALKQANINPSAYSIPQKYQ